MPDNRNPSGSPLTRKKYTPSFNAERVRQVAAGAWQTDVTRAKVLSPTLLGRWQRQALAEAVPSRAEREEIKRLCASKTGGARVRHFKKSPSHLWPTDSVSACEHIAQRTGQVPVRLLCQVLCVAPSPYYAGPW